MFLDKETRSLIDRIANIARKNILGSSYSNAELASVLNNIFGIKIYYSDTKKFDGYLGLEKYDGKNHPIIVLNRKQSAERQLFTLAHELGHLVLHYGYMPGVKEDEIQSDSDVLSISGYYRDLDKTEDTTDPVELQANQFAGTLLMPAEEVKKLVDGMDSFADKVAVVAKQFGVTEKAASKRLKILEKVGEDNS